MATATKQKLTKQEKKFIEIKAETGNGTLAAKEAFGITNDNYAGVKAHELLRLPKIQGAIADALPDDLLAQVHLEGLQAVFTDKYNSDEPDYATRQKYLDAAYKLKGSYAAERHANTNVNINVEASSDIDIIASRVAEELKVQKTKYHEEDTTDEGLRDDS